MLIYVHPGSGWRNSSPSSHHNSTATEAACLEARLFTLDSPFIRRQPELAKFALESFTQNCLLIESILHLNESIFTEFKYDTEFSTLAAPVLDVMNNHKACARILRI